MEINLKITADPELIALLTRAVKALDKGIQLITPGPVEVKWPPVDNPVPEVVTPSDLVPYSTETPPEFTLAQGNSLQVSTSAPELGPTATVRGASLSEVSEVKNEVVDISSQELQTNVVKLTVQKPALRASIKAIVNEYADKLSAIPEGQRSIVWERIKQLAEEN